MGTLESQSPQEAIYLKPHTHITNANHAGFSGVCAKGRRHACVSMFASAEGSVAIGNSSDDLKPWLI